MTALPIISSEPVMPPATGGSGKARRPALTRQARPSPEAQTANATTGPEPNGDRAKPSDQADRPPAGPDGSVPADRRAEGPAKGRTKPGRSGRKTRPPKSPLPTLAAGALGSAEPHTPPAPFAEVIRKLAFPQDQAPGTSPETDGPVPAKAAPLAFKGLAAPTAVARPLQPAPQAKPVADADVGQEAPGLPPTADPRPGAAQPVPGHGAAPPLEVRPSGTPIKAEHVPETQDGSQAAEPGTGGPATSPAGVALQESPDVSVKGPGQTPPPEPGGADPSDAGRTAEARQTTFESVRPPSRVGAESSGRTDHNTVEPDPAAARPGPGRMPARQAEPTRSAEATVEPARSAGATVEPAGQTVQPARAQASPDAAGHVVSGPGQVEPTSQGQGPSRAAPPPRPAWPEVADQVTEQVRLVRPQAGQRVVVRLNPPRLGRVRLTFRDGRGGIRGTIEVDNERTLAQLRSATPPMIERLTEGGIALRQLTLVLSGQNENTAGDGSPTTPRDGALAQQQHQGRGDQGPQGEERWSETSAAPDQAHGAHPATGHVSDDSVNVWI